MGKLKTHKGATKRFKITKKGKVLAFRAGKRHLLSKKSSKRKMALGKYKVLKERAAAIIKRLLVT